MSGDSFQLCIGVVIRTLNDTKSHCDSHGHHHQGPTYNTEHPSEKIYIIYLYTLLYEQHALLVLHTNEKLVQCVIFIQFINE